MKEGKEKEREREERGKTSIVSNLTGTGYQNLIAILHDLRPSKISTLNTLA